jgi:hypothetical protein
MVIPLERRGFFSFGRRLLTALRYRESKDSTSWMRLRPAFIHNEVLDKIVPIGGWLGFQTSTKTKVAGGAVVDAVWEVTIGNMGRVIQFFEVQT